LLTWTQIFDIVMGESNILSINFFIPTQKSNKKKTMQYASD